MQISKVEKKEEYETSITEEESSVTSASDDADVAFIGGAKDLHWDEMVVEASDVEENRYEEMERFMQPRSS